MDTKTGLQYNRARWLNTNTARFLSEDPIGFAGGDYNLYRYVQNNTTNATDPSGTEGEWNTPPRFSPGLQHAVPRYRNHQIVGGMGGTQGLGAPLSDGIPILAAVVGIFVEPVDWVLTGYEIWSEPGSLWSYAGLIPFVPAAVGKGGKVVSRGIYEVGRAADLRKVPIAGTSIHHAPQSRQAESLIGDFNLKNKVGNEPAVRLPHSEHLAINAAQAARSAPASARDLLASDVRLLRQYTGMSNAQIKQLIKLVRDSHFEDFAPLHRIRTP